MVSVNNYVLRNRKDGTTFVALELVGGLEMIKSNTTGISIKSLLFCNYAKIFRDNQRGDRGYI